MGASTEMEKVALIMIEGRDVVSWGEEGGAVGYVIKSGNGSDDDMHNDDSDLMVGDDEEVKEALALMNAQIKIIIILIIRNIVVLR